MYFLYSQRALIYTGDFTLETLEKLLFCFLGIDKKGWKKKVERKSHVHTSHREVEMKKEKKLEKTDENVFHR